MPRCGFRRAMYKPVADKTEKCSDGRLTGGFIKATLRRSGSVIKNALCVIPGTLGAEGPAARASKRASLSAKLLARGGQEQRGARWTKDNAKVTLSRGVLTFPWPRTTFGPGLSNNIIFSPRRGITSK